MGLPNTVSPEPLLTICTDREHSFSLFLLGVGTLLGLAAAGSLAGVRHCPPGV